MYGNSHQTSIIGHHCLSVRRASSDIPHPANWSVNISKDFEYPSQVIRHLSKTTSSIKHQTFRFLPSPQNLHKILINNLMNAPGISSAGIDKLHHHRVYVFEITGDALIAGQQTRMLIGVNG